MQNIEDKLIEDVISGSHKSFAILYEKWVSHLYRFVFSMVKSENLAEDIVQETFVRIWTNRASLNPNLSFKSYLFTISYRMTLLEFKRQVKHPQMKEYMEYCNEKHASDSLAEQQLDFDMFLVKLENAKRKLSPRQLQIFELNKEQNIPISDIAEQLGLTDQSVRNQLSAALKAIRKEMRHYSFLLVLFLSC